jgi:GGDEF domain-containing protein
VVCDINGLKSVNDQHGHDSGDRILKALGQILAQHAHERFSDALVARLGGDELAVAVAGVSPDDLVAYAEDVCSEAWRTLPHGAAVGVASTGDAIGSIDNDRRLFRLADAVGWWLSRLSRGEDEVATVEYAIYRALPGLTEKELSTEIRERFTLSDYPRPRRPFRGA